jgi:acyl-CoA thioesterase
VPLGDDPLLHRAGLTYLSDLGSGFGQLGSAVVGRGGPSVDHSMWFQNSIRADDWVLLDLRPVKAGWARGCYQGSLRDRHGALGATLYQEHLLLPGSLGGLQNMLGDPTGQVERVRDPEEAEAVRQAHTEHPAGR